MIDGLVPFLWLCGPSGVGKSTVGWEIFTQLQRSGVPAAYLDTDQLRHCYPAPDDDPDNDALSARNIAVVWPTFRAAGARCLIVSGGLNRRALLARYAGVAEGTTMTLCRLRAGHAELRERIERRGWLTHLADESVAEADAMDRDDVADLCVDTDGLSVPEVARRVRERAGGWPTW